MTKFEIINSLYRPNTLLLAITTVMTGTLLSVNYGTINPLTVLLILITAILLQIIANIANDTGDYIKGTDNERLTDRQSILQTKILSVQKIKKILKVHVIITAIIGTILILQALNGYPLKYYIVFFGTGFAAIVAAILYTLSSNPYGYKGLGDISCFMFFGPIGVIGTFFLITKTFTLIPVLPSLAVGFLTAAVLNTNNIRDYVNDAANKKNTLVVKIGLRNAKIYHVFLFIAAHSCLLSFSLIYRNNWYAFLYIFVFFIQYVILIKCLNKNSNLNKCLGMIVVSTFILMLAFGVCSIVL